MSTPPVSGETLLTKNIVCKARPELVYKGRLMRSWVLRFLQDTPILLVFKNGGINRNR